MARHGARLSARRKERQGHASAMLESQLAFSQPQYADPPVEPISTDHVEAIHDASLRVLSEIGILFLNDEALSILSAEGCDIDWARKNVRFDRDWILQKIALAPEQFSITARNPTKTNIWGGKHFNFGNVGSPPNVIDLEQGRRVGTRVDFQNLLKLSQSFNCIHFISGYPVEPLDVHASVRHLHCLYDKLTLTDKVVHAYSLGAERVEDALEMVRIAGGYSQAEFDASPKMFTNINSSSPLKHDLPMLDGAIRFARHGQPVVIAPFTLAGAMAPVTIAGAIVQQNAEALAAIAFLQSVNPGTPVVYGAFTSNVDMKSGAPAFGTPEYLRAMQISGQMARFYKVPWRGSNANAANAPDAQAVWESAFSLQGTCSGGANVVFHAAGWLEGGLSASYEKFIIDCEMLQQIIYAQNPIPMTAEDLAVEAIAEVGPDGHFFGVDHTQSRYKTAFYNPILSDWRNYESWEEAGAQWTHQRAHHAYKQILDEFEAPVLDPAIKEELSEFVERRAREGGAPTDF